MSMSVLSVLLSGQSLLAGSNVGNHDTNDLKSALYALHELLCDISVSSIHTHNTQLLSFTNFTVNTLDLLISYQ